MRSQVQVLAGPPLFSQLRELTPPTRLRSLPAWAAAGPPALRTRRAKDPAGAGDPRAQSTTRAHSWSPPPSSPGHGRPHAANPALTTRAQSCHSLGCTARIPAPRPTGDPAQPACPWPATRSTWPAARAPPRQRPGSARCRCWPSRACAGSAAPALAVAGAVRGYGRAARPMALAVWLSDAPTRSTKSPVRTQRTRTGTRTRTLTPDTRTPGHPDIARADTGHRAPDTGRAWTLTEDADRATKPRQVSRHLGHHDEPTAR
jgi:hypothetical protein